MATYAELLAKQKSSAAKTSTTPDNAKPSSSYDSLLQKYKAKNTPAEKRVVVEDKAPKEPAPIVSKAVAPTNANLKKTTISAPEEKKPSKLAKVAMGVNNLVKGFVGNLNPAMTFAPDLTKKSAADTLKDTAIAAKNSIVNAKDAYVRFGTKLKDLATVSYNSKASMADRSAAAIDAAASALADVGGATFQVGLDAAAGYSPKFKKMKEAALDKPIQKTSEAVDVGSKKLVQALPVSEQAKQKLEGPVSRLASAGIITLLMHKASKAAGVGAGVKKPVVESPVKPFTDVLGIKHDAGSVLKESAVDAAYKKASENAINRGGSKEQIQARLDVVDSAYGVAKSYAQKGEQRFIAEDLPKLQELQPQAEAVLKSIQDGAANTEANSKAATVDSVLRSEATAESRAQLKNFDKDMQFAFEQELLDLNKRNEGVLSEAAQKGVEAALERISDAADDRPAHYDVLANTIRLNEPVIRKTIDALWQGKTLKIGEGKLVDVFVKRAGESLEDLKTRYEKALVDHEVAHAKTIDPADAARLQLALKTGDTVTAKRLRTDLEERASRYVVEEARKGIDEAVNKAVDTKIAQIEAKRSIKDKIEALKYPEPVKEDAYKEWKKIVSREKGMERATYDEIQSRVGEKKANALFEDALSRGDGNGPMRFDDLINDFQTRFAKEQNVKAEVSRLRDALKQGEGKSPSAFENRRVNRIISEELRKNTTGNASDVSKAVKDRLESDNALKIYQSLSEKGKLKADRSAMMKSIMKDVRRARPTRTKGGTLKGKMTPADQAIMDNVTKVLQRDRGEVLNEAMQKVIDWRKGNPEKIELPQDIVDLVDVAETAGIRQQSMEQLKATQDYIRTIVQGGIEKNKEKLAAQREKRAKLIENAQEYVSGSKEGLPPETMARLTEDGKVKTAANTFWWDTSPAFDFAKALGKGTERLMSETINAAAKVRQRVSQVDNVIENVGRRLYGEDFANEFYQKMHEQVDLGKMELKNGKTADIRTTRHQAMGIYAGLKDAKFKENLTSAEGNAWTPEIIKKVTDVLKPEDKEFIDSVVKETYQGQYGRFSQAVMDRNNIQLGKIENYAGSLRYVKNLAKNVDESASDVLVDGLRRKLGLTEKTVKSRTNFIGELRLSDNPVADALQYTKNTEHYIQMGDIVSKWDAIVNDDNLIRSMESKYGKEFVNNLKMHVEDIRAGGITKERQIAGNTAFQRWNGNISGALIANPSVWVGQLSSIAQFRAEAKSSKAFWKGVRNYKELVPLLKEHAPALDARTLESTAELASRFEGRKGKFGRGLDKIKQKLAVPLEKMDAITSTLGSAGIFNDRAEYYKSIGRSTKDAYRLAGQDVAKTITNTQSTRDYLGKSNLEKRSGVGQAITTLRNQPNKVFRAGINAIADYRAGKINRKELASFLAWNNVMQPTLYYSLRYGTKGVMSLLTAGALSAIGQSKAAEEVKKKAFEGGAKGFAEGLGASIFTNATGAFGVGDVLNLALENGLRGKNYELRPSVVQAVFDDIASVTTQASAGDLDEAALYGIRALSRSYGLGDPGDLIKTTLTTLSAKNKDRKAEEKKTPEAKAAARQKRIQKKIEKARQ